MRTVRSDGAFDVDYDIPLALYDCCLDDGVTPHEDVHNPPPVRRQSPRRTCPESWGKTFFQHYPNHGFVGDIFTVNGTAYPVLEVKRRKYRLRFLGASIARIYEFVADDLDGRARSRRTPPGAPAFELQGQYRFPDGQQCMQLTQIASEGGLLPFPVQRDSFEIWPAKRREFVVDFTKYMDGTPTTKGDVIYLVNTKQMTNGRKPDEQFLEDAAGNPTNEPNPAFDPNYRVPILKIVIGDDAVDNSVMPKPGQKLRPMPKLPSNLKALPQRRFTLHRTGTFGSENQWVINGLPFDPLVPLARPKLGSEEVWTIRERRRRLGAPDAHPQGGAPGAVAQRRAGSGLPASRRHREGGRRGPRARRIGGHLPPVPDVQGQVRGALPQPGPRGSQHDVRVGNRMSV